MKKKQIITQTEVVTQKDKVLWHLQTYGTLTTWEAFNTYRIMRLGAIIEVLRNKQDYNITTEYIPHKLASDSLFPNATKGKGVHAKYIYKEPNHTFISDNKVKEVEKKSFFNTLFSRKK